MPSEKLRQTAMTGFEWRKCYDMSEHIVTDVPDLMKDGLARIFELMIKESNDSVDEPILEGVAINSGRTVGPFANEPMAIILCTREFEHTDENVEAREYAALLQANLATLLKRDFDEIMVIVMDPHPSNIQSDK